ncbi:MAG: 2-hydroxyglutaryl-CoA dehydratase, partial [Bacilli bacterium]
LHGYRLPNMDEIAKAADAFYNNHLRGGEGHMEVGKLILTVRKRKANMTISVKPFGCMPSSGVSDGVQSLVTDIFPEAIFLPIETTGDGAINVYSRIQMMLFRARQAAQTECAQALAETGVAAEQLSELRGHASFNRPLKSPRDVVACTAANAIYGMHNARRRCPL